MTIDLEIFIDFKFNGQYLLPFREDLGIISGVRIISRRRLVEFWVIHPDAEQPLRAWYTDAKKTNWKVPADVKVMYRNVSILPNNRLVFNIKGNNYRLVVIAEYTQGKLFVRFVGTHAEYDRIDASSV